MKIRDRIKKFTRVSASELQQNPKNWRTHPEAQRNALRGILDEVGIAGAVLARETTEGGLMLIDGHLRVDTMGTDKIPVLVLDVTEEEADKLLATLDPLAAMAATDSAKLDDLLRTIETADKSLSEMLAGLAERSGLYSGNLDEAHWGDTGDKSVVPKSCLLNVLMYTADLDEIEAILRRVTIDGERPVDTIKRGLHAIDT